MPLFILAAVILAALKLAGVITLSWLAIFVFGLFPLIVIVIVLALCGIFYAGVAGAIYARS